MKRLAALLIVGILLASSLTGCALKPVEAPVTKAFSKLADKLPTIKSEKPVQLQALPKAEVQADYLVFNKANAKKLLIFKTAAIANTEIAKKQSLAINEQQLVQKNMVMAGKLMEQRANYLAFKWAVAETELQEEQRDHQIDNVLNRTLVIILALLLI